MNADNPDGTIAYVNTAYANLGTLTTDGFEVTYRKSLGTSVGTFTLSGDVAYAWRFKVDEHGTDPDYASNNGAAFQPFGASLRRWKANTGLAWNDRKITMDLSWQYTGPCSNLAAGAIGLTGYDPSLASYSQFNLTVADTCHLRAISDPDLGLRCYPPHLSQIRTSATSEAPGSVMRARGSVADMHQCGLQNIPGY